MQKSQEEKKDMLGKLSASVLTMFKQAREHVEKANVVENVKEIGSEVQATVTDLATEINSGPVPI